MNREPHIFETYQSIGRIENSQTVADTPLLSVSLESSEGESLSTCWALRMGNRGFAAVLQRAGSDVCRLRAALCVTL